MGKRAVGVFLVVAISAGVALAVAFFVLDSDASDSLAPSSAFAPFTSDPGNASCNGAADASGDAPNHCDPINLVFDGVSLESVVSALRNVGWSTFGLGSTQWLFFADSTVMIANDEQLFLQESPDERFHMRLWSASVAGDRPLIIAAVHHEQGFLQHRIDRDWEVAEQRVRSELCSVAAYDCEQGPLIASQLAIQGGAERWRAWANDGRPALIRRASDVGLER